MGGNTDEPWQREAKQENFLALCDTLMHEYGVTMRDIWHTWTSKQLAAFSRKIGERHAVESTNRINDAIVATIDLSKSSEASMAMKRKEAIAKQYMPETGANLTKSKDPEVMSRFNVKVVPMNNE